MSHPTQSLNARPRSPLGTLDLWGSLTPSPALEHPSFHVALTASRAGLGWALGSRGQVQPAPPPQVADSAASQAHHLLPCPPLAVCPPLPASLSRGCRLHPRYQAQTQATPSVVLSLISSI